MCLIIQRDPNFEIPYDKFKSALTVNPDGYGLSFPDSNGKLITLRNPVSPDPEKLYRMVNEELLDKNLLIHLRFTTVGETVMRNAHPFPILERKRDGIDLRMAHNGTLFDYKSKAAKGESDTRAFVRTYVRPLFKRMSKAMDPAELLSDPFIKELLEDKLSKSSVLTFLDGNGQSLICNETGNGGKQDKGWYYSNTYSFNVTHREPVSKIKYYSGSSYSGPKQVESKALPKPEPKATDSVAYLCRGFATEKFSDKYDMDTTSRLTKLSDQTINKAIQIGDASILIKELIYELDKSWGINKKLNATIKSLKGKMQ